MKHRKNEKVLSLERCFSIRSFFFKDSQSDGF